MSEDNPQSEIDDHERKADEEFGEMEGDADAMEDRLERHESGDKEVEVPEPDHGDSLSISEPEGEDGPGDIEGEAAGEARR